MEELTAQGFLNWLCDLNRLEFRRKEIMSKIGMAYMQIARNDREKYKDSLDLLDEALKLLDNKE